MIALLASPIAKYAAIGALVVALLIGAGLYLHGVRQAGVTQEQQAEAARGAQHVETVVQGAAAIDNAIAKEPDPLAALRKDWSR